MNLCRVNPSSDTKDENTIMMPPITSNAGGGANATTTTIDGTSSNVSSSGRSFWEGTLGVISGMTSGSLSLDGSTQLASLFISRNHVAQLPSIWEQASVGMRCLSSFVSRLGFVRSNSRE